jgi:circadian clock protein KaiB
MATSRSKPGNRNAKPSGSNRFSLRLFITGKTLRSSQCLRIVRLIVEKHLEGKADFEVVDIYQQPQLAREAQILAAPTLIRERPLPVRRLVGELTDLPCVLAALGISEVLR